MKSLKSSSITQELFKKSVQYSRHIVNQLNLCKQPYITVSHLSKRLTDAGFVELDQSKNDWSLKGGASYFFTRNGSTLIAFTMGKTCSPTSPPQAFKLVGAHTDSPVLKFAPHSKLSGYGFQEVAVQIYGGGLWHTWFDRDLAVGGRVIVKTPEGKLESRLYDSKRALLRIPNMAIHLQTAAEREAFKINKQTHLRAVISTSIVNALMQKEQKQEQSKDTGCNDKNAIDKKIIKGLLKDIADQCCCQIEDIVDFELSIHDSQPSALIGLYEEFISSPRLDNLLSTLTGVDAIIQEAKAPSVNSNVSLLALFDHQQVGSQSAQGADSSLIPDTLQRIFYTVCDSQKVDGFMPKLFSKYQSTLHNSMFLSVDMAHGVHPNYPEKHQINHMPKFHEGIVLKWNANQRYMTDAIGAAIVKEIAKMANIQIQEFIVRNDSACGSTIGPMVASKLGIKTIDMGVAQLSMHSIREFCGVVDVLKYRDLFSEFYRSFEKVSDCGILDK